MLSQSICLISRQLTILLMIVFNLSNCLNVKQNPQIPLVGALSSGSGGQPGLLQAANLPPSAASVAKLASNPLKVYESQATQSSSLSSFPQASSREIEKQIVDKILGEGYDKRIRPAGFGNASKPGAEGPTIVKVNTLVRSISKIDDVTMEYSVQLSLRQEWTDDRLAFGKMSQYKNYGLNSITLTEQERLWKPDLFFRNEKEGHFHKIIMPNVLLRIRSEGQVLYSIRISLVLACPMDLKYYPLDKQNCTIEMASYGYLDEDLKFIWKEENPVQIAKPLNLPRFTLETHDTAYCTSRTTTARVSLGVTTLLTMATQISGINASLPPVSYTKAIDVWTGVCLTFVFGALLEFALVNYASRSDQHKREMLTSALTQTQQMRWREATAAAAAAGVAPPTSPPPDDNSPSALMSKHQGHFFAPTSVPCNHSLALHQFQAQPSHCHSHQHHQTKQQPTMLLQPLAPPSLGPNGPTNATGSSNNSNTYDSTRQNALQMGAQRGPIATVEGAQQQQQQQQHQANGKLRNGKLRNSASGNNLKSSGKMTNPQINCALQYLKFKAPHKMRPQHRTAVQFARETIRKTTTTAS